MSRGLMDWRDKELTYHDENLGKNLVATVNELLDFWENGTPRLHKFKIKDFGVLSDLAFKPSYIGIEYSNIGFLPVTLSNITTVDRDGYFVGLILGYERMGLFRARFPDYKRGSSTKLIELQLWDIFGKPPRSVDDVHMEYKKTHIKA